MSRARSTIAALSAGLTIAALGACSTQPVPQPKAAQVDTRAPADGLLSQVIGRISEQGSAHSSVSGSLGVVGELTAEGVVRYRGPQTDLGFDGQTRPAGGQLPQDIQLSILDGVGFLKTPLAQPGPGKPWLKVTPGGEDLGAKFLSPALDQLNEAVDPRATFAGIAPATRIQSSAPDTVDGRPTTRYELRIITARAAEMATDPQQRARYRRAVDAGEPELGYQLWLDGSGLPVRFAASQELAQAGRVSLTSTYRDWGTTTEIAAPPDEQVGVMYDFPQPPR